MSVFLALMRLAMVHPQEALLLGAVRRVDVAEVRALLRIGADPNIRERLRAAPSLADGIEGGRIYDGETPLILAVAKRNLELARLLLQSGAKVNAPGAHGYTALHQAVRNRDYAGAKFLLEHRADPNKENDNADPPLIFAINNRDNKMVELLIGKGANPKGGRYSSALIMAIDSRALEVLKTLLRRGADPNHRGRRPTSPLEEARLQGFTEAEEPLRRAGGKARSAKEINKIVESYRAMVRPPQVKKVAPTALDPDDVAVLNVLFTDLATYQGEDFWGFKETSPRRVIVSGETSSPDWYMSDGQMNGELSPEQAQSITLEMRRSLQTRNKSIARLTGLPLSNPLVKVLPVKAYEKDQKANEFKNHGRRVYVWTWRPGYNAARDRAVVRFSFGPSAHGASGTYLLEKRTGKWSIVWRDFAYYV